MKDQIDIKGMPTTLGSVLFRDYEPGTEGFAVARLRAAGAIFLGKSTLGELGGGDTHGSLFGSTRNVYDLERTAGGSSGGSGASVSANFCTVAVGQEGFASIRRPSTWNGIVGMRPTVGLVSRSGVYGGWPTINGSLGPMARTVTDAGEAARQHGRLRSARSGYGLWRWGVCPRAIPPASTRHALSGARIGILREPMGYESEPDSDDFKKVDEVFDKAVAELEQAGAEIDRPDRHPRSHQPARDVAPRIQQPMTRCSNYSSPTATRRSTPARRRWRRRYSPRSCPAASSAGRLIRPKSTTPT